MVEVQSHCTSNLVWRLNLTHPFAAYVSAGRESDASFHFVCSICFQLTAKPQTVAVTHDMAVSRLHINSRRDGKRDASAWCSSTSSLD